MSNTNKVRSGVDANIIEANVVRGHDAILTGNLPEDIQFSPGRNNIDDTVSLLTVWNRTDDQGQQVFDLRAGVDFSTAERAQVFVGDFDPSGTTPAVAGSLFIRVDDPKLYQNTDGAMAWKVISDDLGGENLEETLTIGNFTGNNPIVISNQLSAAIQGEDSVAGTGGGPVRIRGGNETGGAGNGGELILATGASAAGNTGNLLGTTADAVGGGASGSLQWIVGTTDSGAAGEARLEAGSSTTGIGGTARLQGGATNAVGGVFSGFAAVAAGNASNGGIGGWVLIDAGHATTPPLPPPIPGSVDLGGSVRIQAGASGGVREGGDVIIRAGQGGPGGGDGGDVVLSPGNGGGGNPDGIVNTLGIFQSDNIKRGNGDPNALMIAGNEGDVYQRTTGGIGELWLNTNGQPTGWVRLAFGGGFIEAFSKLQFGYWSPAGHNSGGLSDGVADVGLYEDARITLNGASAASLSANAYAPHIFLNASGLAGNHAIIDTATATPLRIQHRFLAVFKFDNTSVDINQRMWVGLGNPDGVSMLANDLPAGEYIGFQKANGVSGWRFLSRGTSIFSGTLQIDLGDTDNVPNYLVIDASDPNNISGTGQVVLTLLNHDLIAIAAETVSGTGVPTFATSLRPVVGIQTEVGGPNVALRMYNATVVTEADILTGLIGGGGAGNPTLETVLTTGNETGANSIVLTDHLPLGGVIQGEDDAPLNAPDGGRVTISAGSTTNILGTGGDLSLFSGFPAIGAATRSGSALLSSANVLDALNTGGTGDTLLSTGLTTGTGNTGVLTLQTGSAASGNTGTINLRSGDSVGGQSGDVELHTGDGVQAGLLSLEGGNSSGGSGGNIVLFAGDGGGVATGLPGSLSLQAGRPDPASAFSGGAIQLTATPGATTGVGGFVRLIAGDGGPGGGPADGGPLDLFAGDGGVAGGDGGDLTLVAGSATGGVSDGGDIILTPGAGFGGGSAGSVTVNGKLTVTGLIDPTGLVLAGQPVAPTVVSPGDGLIWVDNTGINTVLRFTDDAGSTITLGSGGANLATVLAVGNSTSGQPITGGDNAAGTGQNLRLFGGNSTGGGGSGGSIQIGTGSPDPAANASAGALQLFTRSGAGSGFGGDASFTTGSGDGGAPAGGRGGNLTTTLGAGGTNAPGGSFSLTSGAGNGIGGGGDIDIVLGNSGLTGGGGGAMSVQTGNGLVGSGSAGGDFSVMTGSGDAAADGGNMVFTGGAGGAGGVGGGFQFTVGSGGDANGVFAVTGDATFSNDVTITGKLTVPLIDPIGVGFTGTGANPIPIGGSNDGTIWVDPTGDLIFTNLGGDTNLSTGELEPDGSAYKFGTMAAAAAATTAIVFATPFPAGPPLVINVTIEGPAATPPPSPHWIHSIGVAGFTVEFAAAPPPATFTIHWTARH